MGGQHNELRRGELSAAVKNALGDSRGGGLERYSETLTPVINPWGMPEWAWLRGELLLGRRYAQALVAGEFAMLGLLNPTTAGNNLVVVEAISTSTPSLLEVVTEALALVTLLATAPGWVRDRRIPESSGAGSVRGQAIGLAGSDVAPSVSTQIIDRTFAAGPFSVGLPIILPAGHAIVVSATTVALALEVTFAWRERTAYSGELG